MLMGLGSLNRLWLSDIMIASKRHAEGWASAKDMEPSGDGFIAADGFVLSGIFILDAELRVRIFDAQN